MLRRAQKHRRRVALAGGYGSFTKAEWDAIVARQRGRCADCGERKPLTVDHIVPVARGGCNFAFNIQGLCGPCNGRKNDRITDQQWSLFDGHRESKKPKKRTVPRVDPSSRAKPELKRPAVWADVCQEHTPPHCKACDRARARRNWRRNNPEPPPRVRKEPEPKVKREPKELLRGVSIPQSAYALVVAEASKRKVTIASIVAEAVLARYGDPHDESDARDDRTRDGTLPLPKAKTKRKNWTQAEVVALVLRYQETGTVTGEEQAKLIELGIIPKPEKVTLTRAVQVQADHALAYFEEMPDGQRPLAIRYAAQASSEPSPEAGGEVTSEELIANKRRELADIEDEMDRVKGHRDDLEDELEGLYEDQGIAKRELADLLNAAFTAAHQEAK